MQVNQNALVIAGASTKERWVLGTILLVTLLVAYIDRVTVGV
jgi:hypothetical protein